MMHDMVLGWSPATTRESGMKVLVCGSRDWKDQHTINTTLDTLNPTTLIAGDCRGADSQAVYWAKHHGIVCRTYKADWDRIGRRAGPERNQRMIDCELPDLVVAFKTSPESRGTDDCLRRARNAGIRTVEIIQK